MKKQSGFTLIEVMIVVVVVAILAAIAVPSYQDSIRKTRRAEAKEALTSAAALQERYFFSNNSYAANVGALNISGTSAEGYYTIAVTEGPTCTSGTTTFPCYVITATAQGAQADDTQCATFTINQTGRTASENGGGTDTTDICW